LLIKTIKMSDYQPFALPEHFALCFNFEEGSWIRRERKEIKKGDEGKRKEKEGEGRRRRKKERDGKERKGTE
jgi:hypothetical protein